VESRDVRTCVGVLVTQSCLSLKLSYTVQLIATNEIVAADARLIVLITVILRQPTFLKWRHTHWLTAIAPPRS